MARSWLIDCRGIATKVKNASLSPTYQIKDCGANRKCPKCYYRIDNSDVSHEWPGFPTGVKFDPSDAELLEHLAAKCGVGNSKPHMFIDDFIQTINNEEGICYTHPENLPGAKKDGSSVHFFHRTSNAYATGQRKRRKIHNEHNLGKDDVRWHKTGKTKPVVENGVHLGYKKIMVLYRVAEKGSKPDKCNWAMHQYHLGTNEDELEGQFVVCKIYYQQKHTDNNDSSQVVEDSDMATIRTSPQTPKTNAPNPPRPGKSVSCDDVIDDYAPQSSAQEADFGSHPSSAAAPPLSKDDKKSHNWLAGQSQPVDSSDLDASLFCNEIFDSYPALGNSGLLNGGPFNDFAQLTYDIPGAGVDDRNATYGISDLENIELDTPPDFHDSELQFCSQDSLLGWLDRVENND